MHGFSVDSFRSEKTTNPNGDYSYQGYASRPEDFSNRSVFDYDRPIPSESRNRWLDDYGWL